MKVTTVLMFLFPLVLIGWTVTFASGESTKAVSNRNTSAQCPQCQIGLTRDKPANSCHDIYHCNRNAKSGLYWIKTYTTNNTAQQFYCEIEQERCGIVGMMRVAHVDMTSPCQQCPPPLAQYWAGGKRVCGPSLDSRCDPVVFPVHGIPYNHVCGRALGYSFYAPCAFDYNTRPLSQHYLTGLSITQGPLGDNDSHIWSYAAGYREVGSDNCNCPCAKNPGHSPPSYVGTHYYCDTATVTGGSQQWYSNNTLWDGKDCYPGTNCCANTRLPWFWRTLKQETNNDITVRWCADRDLKYDNFGTELLEIYIH